MTRTSIVHVVGTAGTTGVESVVASLADRLRSSHRICVVCLANGPLVTRLEQLGVDVVVHVVRSKFRLDSLVPLTVELLRRRPVLVHTHGARGMLYGNVAARLAGVPTVVTTFHEASSAGDRAGVTRRFGVALENLATRLTASRVVAISRFIEEDVRERRGFDPAMVTCIPNGVDTDAFREFSPEVRRRAREGLGWGDQELVFGAAGRLVELKGFDVLLRAFRESGLADAGATLRVIGDGPQRDQLLAERDALGLRKAVTLSPARPHLRDWLPLLDVFVQPSLQEGLGLSLLEAMATGRPVVASRTGGIPEFVRHEESGLLVQPGDAGSLASALRKIARDPVTRHRLGRAGAESIRTNYDLRVSVEAHTAMYRLLWSRRAI